MFFNFLGHNYLGVSANITAGRITVHMRQEGNPKQQDSEAWVGSNFWNLTLSCLKSQDPVITAFRIFIHHIGLYSLFQYPIKIIMSYKLNVNICCRRQKITSKIMSWNIMYLD